MTAMLQQYLKNSINFEIQNHPAWHGCASGLKAEKMLRGKKSYLYILRAGEYEGENETDYYVTFVDSDSSVRHQPFVITTTDEGWYYENGNAGGPYANASIDDVIHMIMHCDKEQCTPFINFDK